MCSFPRRRKDAAVLPASRATSRSATPKPVASTRQAPPPRADYHEPRLSRDFKYRTRQQALREEESSRQTNSVCPEAAAVPLSAEANGVSAELCSKRIPPPDVTPGANAEGASSADGASAPSDDCAALQNLEAELAKAREDREREFQRFQARCDYEQQLVDKLKSAQKNADVLRKIERKRKLSVSHKSLTESAEALSDDSKTDGVVSLVASAQPPPAKRHRSNYSARSSATSVSHERTAVAACSSPVALTPNSVRVPVPRAVSAPTVFIAESPRSESALRAGTSPTPTVTFPSNSQSHASGGEEKTIRTYHKLIAEHIRNASKRVKSESNANISSTPKVEVEVSSPHVSASSSPKSFVSSPLLGHTSAPSPTSAADTSSRPHPLPRPRLRASIYPPLGRSRTVSRSPTPAPAPPPAHASVTSRSRASPSKSSVAAPRANVNPTEHIKKEVQRKSEYPPLSNDQSRENHVKVKREPTMPATTSGPHHRRVKSSSLTTQTPPPHGHAVTTSSARSSPKPKLDMESFHALTKTSRSATASATKPLRTASTRRSPDAKKSQRAARKSGTAVSGNGGGGGGRSSVQRAIKTCQTCFVAKTRCCGKRPCDR